MQTSISLQAFDPENVYALFHVTHWDDEGSCAPSKQVECEYEITDCELGVQKNELHEFMPDYDEMHVYLIFPEGHTLSDAEMQGCFEVFKRVLRAKHMTI